MPLLLGEGSPTPAQVGPATRDPEPASFCSAVVLSPAVMSWTHCAHGAGSPQKVCELRPQSQAISRW